MKRITKKQAEALVKKKWGRKVLSDGNADVGALCVSMPCDLMKDWINYWGSINTERKYFIWQYALDPSFKEDDFLRLLTVHLFIRHTYKD